MKFYTTLVVVVVVVWLHYMVLHLYSKMHQECICRWHGMGSGHTPMKSYRFALNSDDHFVSSLLFYYRFVMTSHAIAVLLFCDTDCPTLQDSLSASNKKKSSLSFSNYFFFFFCFIFERRAQFP